VKLKDSNRQKLDFSIITEDLIIGTTPRSEAYTQLRSLGVSLVINMRWERRPYRDDHNPPLPALWLPTFDSPFIPIPVHVLSRGARAALPVIAGGRSVYVHCQMGRHRGVAMGAAILIAQGASAEAATRLIKERRPVADPDIWYIRRQILRFEKAWDKGLME
jgi:protein-tyrosine phosphatase